MLDWKHYKNTVKSNVLEGFTAFMAKNVSITVCLTGNIGKTLSKTMFWKDFLYICWIWLPALEHGKVEENTVNSSIFNGWGDKGIGSIVEHDVFDRFYGDKSVKYRALKGTIAKTWKHIQRTRDLSRRRCLAIWNSAAWRASKGGKSENSLAWEAPTGGKSENSLAWGAPTGGKSENSLAWGAPTGGESENIHEPSSYVCQFSCAALLLIFHTTLSPSHGPK